MAQLFLELNTASSGPYFSFRKHRRNWLYLTQICVPTMKDALQKKQRDILSTADCFRRESLKKRIEIAGVNVEGQAIHLCDNAGKWWCKRWLWLRLRASSYLNGSSDQEEASNTRPFNYRSWSMHVKHGDIMLDHGIWEMRWCANGHCIGMPLLTEKSLDLSHLPLSFLWTYTCNDVHLFSLCTFIPSPTFSQPGSMNRSWTVRTSS